MLAIDPLNIYRQCIRRNLTAKFTGRVIFYAVTGFLIILSNKKSPLAIWAGPAPATVVAVRANTSFKIEYETQQDQR